MEEASCEKASYVSSYVDNTGDFAVIQGPAARIRPSHLPDNYFSCEFPSIKHLQVCSVTQCQFVCNPYGWPCPALCFSPQSTMRAWWRTCRYAKYSKCDFCIDKKNEKLSACLASRQTIPFSLRCVLILLFCVCSEVQDRWPANEAVPQRKPPQKDALCQQQTHRERTPLYEKWVAGCTVSHPSVHWL